MHLDGVHPHLRGAFEVESAVVDKATLYSRELGRLQGEAINIALRLAQADEAGADKEPKNLAQSEGLDPVTIELARLVIDGAHEVFAGFTELLRERDDFGERLG